jgi:hypothetical protein
MVQHMKVEGCKMIFKKNLYLELGKVQKEEIKVNEIVKRKIHLMIADEKLFIKKFIFPNVHRSNTYFLVKNELNFSVGNITDILFDYKVVKILKNSIEVLVFYINTQKIQLIKKLNEFNSIKEIKIIQFQVLEFYKNIIKKRNYILVFHYINSYYFLGIINNNLIANVLIKDMDLETKLLEEYLESFISDNMILKGHTIYLSNVEIMDIEKKFEIIKLKNFQQEKLYNIR